MLPQQSSQLQAQAQEERQNLERLHNVVILTKRTTQNEELKMRCDSMDKYLKRIWV